jgi:hypothetical protein
LIPSPLLSSLFSRSVPVLSLSPSVLSILYPFVFISPSISSLSLRRGLPSLFLSFSPCQLSVSSTLSLSLCHSPGCLIYSSLECFPLCRSFLISPSFSSLSPLSPLFTFPVYISLYRSLCLLPALPLCLPLCSPYVSFCSVNTLHLPPFFLLSPSLSPSRYLTRDNN